MLKLLSSLLLSRTLLVGLFALAVGILAWTSISRWFLTSKEVRRLRRLKRALETQLRAKRQVLELRRQVGVVQAELDAQEAEEMRRIEEQIAALGIGRDQPAAATGSATEAASDGEQPSTSHGLQNEDG